MRPQRLVHHVVVLLLHVWVLLWQVLVPERYFKAVLNWAPVAHRSDLGCAQNYFVVLVCNFDGYLSEGHPEIDHVPHLLLEAKNHGLLSVVEVAQHEG